MKKGDKKSLKKFQDGGTANSKKVAANKANYKDALIESKKADLMLSKLKGKKVDLDLEKLKKSKPQYKKGGTKTSKKK